MKRIAILINLLALSMPALAAPVLAVVPGNDTYAGRTVIGSLTFSQVLDTSEATTDADDVELNAGCAPATDASVWYELTLPADEIVLVDVTGADYTAGILVGTGSPGSFEQVGCGPGTVVFEAMADVTYAILVFDDQGDGTGNGGVLTITTDEAPPPPTINLEIDPEGTYNPLTDVASISGTVTCSETMSIEVSVTVSQNIGRHTVIGGGFIQVECGPDGTSGPVEVVGFTSTFNPGTVTVVADVFGCTFLCAEAHAEAEVRLRAAPARPPEPPAPLANDEPGGAFAIALDATVTQDTAAATASELDPTTCAAEPVPPSGQTVWYAFTAPDDGFYEVNTIGSDYDTVVFILAPDGSVAGCDDDIVGGIDQDSLAIFDGVAGTTYLVMAGSFEGLGGGSLVLTVTTSEVGPPPPPPPADDPPANDDRADAIALEVGDAIGPDDTSTATSAADGPQPTCAPPMGATVWYTVTPASDGWIEVTTFGSDYDTVVVVLADEQEIACNDDAGDVQSRAVFLADAGTTYEIVVGSYGGSPGGQLALAINESEPPLMVDLSALRATLDTRSGIVTLQGVVACSDEAFAEISIGLEQQNGRFGVFGEGGTFVESCSPDGTAFEAMIVGQEAFRPGDAFVFADAFALTDDEQAFTGFGEPIRLQPAGSRR